MMNRMLKIIAVIIFLIIGFKVLQFFGGQWLLNQENNNSRLNKEKSKLNCEQLPVHCAVRDKNYIQLKSILPGDPFLETLDGWAHTPLYLAIREIDDAAVEILLTKGANPNVYDEHGTPALLTAVSIKYVGTAQNLSMYSIAESLLKHGAQPDIEVTDKNRFTFFPIFIPLGSCVSSNDLKFVLLLLKYGANVDKKSSNEKFENKVSIYEMAKGNSNVSHEINRLLEERHNPAFKRDSPRSGRAP